MPPPPPVSASPRQISGAPNSSAARPPPPSAAPAQTTVPAKRPLPTSAPTQQQQQQQPVRMNSGGSPHAMGFAHGRAGPGPSSAGSTPRGGMTPAGMYSAGGPVTPGGTLVRKNSMESIAGDSGKKKRVSLSCAQCAKRKQKCNREFPCQHCLARKVPELCIPYNPQANNTSNGPDPGTASRLDKLESVLSVVVRHHGGLWAYKDVRDWMEEPHFKRLFPEDPRRQAAERNAEQGGAWQDDGTAVKTEDGPGGSSRRYSTGADGDHGEMMDLDRTSSQGGVDGLDRLGDLDGGMPESMSPGAKVNIKLDIHGTPAENLSKLITECGVSPHKVAELVQELPPKHFADKVIDWFFTKINYTRYPIDERLFRISFEDLYDKSAAVDPSNVRALPLVFIVLALGVRLAPDEWAGDDNARRLSSLRMYWSSRRAILLATAVQSESLELVITRLLSALYLVAVHDRRLTECWSQLGASLRTAQAIGLHRDGAKIGLDPFQTEYRRRIWSYLYHADKLYSLVLGRPPSISDSYTDTLPPSNIDLNEFHPSVIESNGKSAQAPAKRRLISKGLPVAKPFSQPTTATYLILRKTLAKIVGKIVHHFQKLDEPAQYSDVEKLQQEIDTFTDELPPHFKMHGPDKSLDATLFWLPVHRFTLLTEILVTTIILHRPWLLRKLSSNRYAASRTACFEAAKLDFQIRQDYQREVPDFHLFLATGQFKMFNSAMIAGISAIIDPRGPDGDFMRKILTTFLEQNPWSTVSGKDETTRKEVQIIQTLSRRAVRIYEESFAPGELDNQDKDSAALLLALRNSGDRAAPRPTKPMPARSAAGASTKAEEPARPAGVAQRRSVQLPSITANVPPPQQAAAMNQSPSSSNHEDDTSQRLLDHWLNANHSLAVGNINGQVAPLDPTGYGFLPFAASNANPLSALTFNFPSGPVANSLWADPSISSLGGMALPSGLSINGGNASNGGGPGLGGISLDLVGMMGSEAPQPLASNGGGATLGGLSSAARGRSGSDADAGLSRGTDSAVGPEGENSDEYWNALIDGILGTTGGLGNGTTN